MNTLVRHLLVGSLCLVIGCAVARAQGKLGQRYPLTANAIACSLHKDGLDVHPEDVHMPMMLSAAVSDPVLEMVGADRMPDGHLRLRLRCHKAGDCVAFSVTLTHGTGVPSLLAAAPALPKINTAPANAAATHLTERADEQSGESAQPSSDKVEAPLSLHPGAKVTMLLDEGHIHIHLPVLLVEIASAGKETRVVTPDHKQVYRAVVLDATTVRGIIE